MSTRTKHTQSTSPGSWRRFVRLRPKVWASLLSIAVLGVGGHFLWRQQAASIARRPQYQLTSEAIHISPLPAWIRSDIKTEALRDAGLPGNLSLLEDWDTLVQRLRQAFEFHPWVKSVDRISRRLPSSLDIELTYRRPLAAVEVKGPGGVALLPVDVAGVRLPDVDLTDAERRFLPRIVNVSGRPLIGATWEDPRVVGGVKLASALQDVWRQLQLVEIIPSPHPQVQGDARFYSFEIVTNGRTRIVWGAAPGDERSAGESPFAEKRKRLLEFAATGGRLDSIHGPAAVDVRKELLVTPRTAKREENEVR
jgi:hypothetical protein